MHWRDLSSPCPHSTLLPLVHYLRLVYYFSHQDKGGNLPGAPALVGNVVVWKPSPAATYSNYLIHKILLEAGLPPSVIQFVPGPPSLVVGEAIKHKSFAALHFTGSTHVFKQLWRDIANNLDLYKSYPRIVGETGGKNWHVVHESADVHNAVLQSTRAAFEYQGNNDIVMLLLINTHRVLQVRNAPPYPGFTFPGPYGMQDSKISSLSKLVKSKSDTQRTFSILWDR